MEQFLSMGAGVAETVLTLAGLLKSDAAPGIVALGFVAALFIFSLHFQTTLHRRLKALRTVRKELSKAGEGADFAKTFSEIAAHLAESARTGPALKPLATAWSEYAETVLVDRDPDGRPVAIRNSVRPSTFFNLEDIGFGPGWYRILPNLFVSVGLFFTFLGLVAALQVASSGAIDDRSIQQLLNVASAKFIMSLTGLACSILFTVLLRHGTNRVERNLHALCRAIENRLSFISLEDIALQQLETSREQKENFRQVGFELVAELARPLRDELPGQIGRAINEGLAPVLNHIQDQSANNVRNMAAELSSQISSDVGSALTEASRHLSEAAGRIGQLADRLDGSSRTMGEEMERAVGRMTAAVEDLRGEMARSAETASGALNEGAGQMLATMNEALGALSSAVGDLRTTMRDSAAETSATLSAGAEELQRTMNETLAGIERNTREGAQAMSDAASEMGKAAEIFRTELQGAAESGAQAARAHIDAAGQDAASGIKAAGEDVQRLAGEAQDMVLHPLEAIQEALESLVARIDEGAVGMARMSGALGTGADRVSEASERFSGASDRLVAAADPLVASSRQIERATQSLEASSREVAEAMWAAGRQTAEAARKTLEQSVEILGHKRQAIADALHGVQTVTREMKGQGDRIDEIDAKLGRAFETYNNKVEAALGSIRSHVENMQTNFAEAVDTLRSVISEAEDFMPQQQRSS